MEKPCGAVTDEAKTPNKGIRRIAAKSKFAGVKDKFHLALLALLADGDDGFRPFEFLLIDGGWAVYRPYRCEPRAGSHGLTAKSRMSAWCNRKLEGSIFESGRMSSGSGNRGFPFERANRVKEGDRGFG